MDSENDGCLKILATETIPLFVDTSTFTRLVSYHNTAVPHAPSDLCHLSSIPSLKNVEVHLRPEGHSLDIQQDAVPTSLATLDSFVIHSDYLDQCNVLLRIFRFPALSSLSVYVANASSAIPFRVFCELLSAQPCKDSLKRLKMDLVPPEKPQGSNTPIIDIADAVPFLLRFIALAQFTVSGWCYIAAADIVLERMARAWPNMAEFTLQSNIRHSADEAERLAAIEKYLARATLNGLIPFALYCPRLWKLTLHCIDASAPPAEDPLRLALPALPLRRPHFLVLSVGTSPISDAFQVASFLSACFPRLFAINTTHDGPEASVRYRLWRTALLLMPVFRKIRRQERRWKEAQHARRLE